MQRERALEELSLALASLRRLPRHTSKILTDAGLDVSGRNALMLGSLLWDGEQSVANLAAAVGIDLGAVSRQMSAFEREGWVRRRQSGDDRRVTLVALTAKGRRFAERVMDAQRRAIDEQLSTWSPEELSALARLVARFLEDVTGAPVLPDTSVELKSTD